MRAKNGRLLKDRIFRVMVTVISTAAVAPLFFIIVYVAYKGAPVVFSEGLSFITQKPAPVMAERLGGIAPALTGTFYLAASSTAIAVPIALFSAVFATEFPRSPLSRVVKVVARTFLEIATITIGMLVFFLIVLPMGRFSAIAGTTALSIVMLPYIYTYTESALMSVPSKYVEAAYSLGMSRAQVIFKVKLKIAWRALLRGIFIGIMKVTGETAPLVFTIYGARSMLFSGLFEPIDALPLMIFHFIQSGFENWRALAWGGAFILLVIYLSMFALNYILTRERR